MGVILDGTAWGGLVCPPGAGAVSAQALYLVDSES